MNDDIDGASERILGLAAQLLIRLGDKQAATFLASVTSMRHRRVLHIGDSTTSNRRIDLTIPAEQFAFWPSLTSRIHAALDEAWPGSGYLSVEVHVDPGQFDPDWRNQAF